MQPAVQEWLSRGGTVVRLVGAARAPSRRGGRLDEVGRPSTAALAVPYLQEDGVFLPDDTAAIPRLAELDAALLTDGDYRRDDWDVVANPAAAAGVAAGAAGAAPNVAAAAAVGPQPSPSGPLYSGRDGLLSGSPRSSQGADSDSDSGSGSEAPGPRSLDWATRFPQLRAALDSAISSLGGRVVPKLNWSCPSDALWISPGGSLACRNAEQVVLLLKSSDRMAAHDVALLAAAAAAADATAATAATVAAGESEVGEAEGPAAGEAAAAAAPSAAVSRTQAQVASTSAESCGDHPQQPPQQRGPQQQPEDQQQQQGCSQQQAQGDAWGQEEVRPGGRGDRGGAAGEGAGPGPGSSSAGGGRSGGGALRQLQPVLVLKKWYNLRPEREFRCFVRGGALVAASQRDVSQTFPALTPEAVAEAQRRLWRFWRDKLRGSLPLADFAFDVYVPSDAAAAVRLVDVNPLTDTTAPLLYEWEELGFGPAAVQPAEALLQRLLQSTTTSGFAAAACSGAGVDESWMDEAAAEGPAALPLPSCAEELLVRTVQDTSRGPRAAAAAAGSGPDGDGGGSGLAGLIGPMLLGSRAALAMPYDMLGIADSVDKLIEAMQAQHAQHKRRRRHQHGGRGGGGGAQTGSDSDDNDDDDDDSASGSLSLGEDGEGCVAGAASSVAVRGQRPASAAAAGAREGAGGREGGGDACDDVGVGPSAAELATVFGGEEGEVGGCRDLDLAEETGLLGGADTDAGLAAQAVAMKDIMSGGSEGLRG